MPPWNVLLLGVLKEGLNCDGRRRTEFANCHATVRQFLGRSSFSTTLNCRRTLMDNAALVTPELLAQVNHLVVEAGHKIRGKKPGSELAARRDSFAVETDMHYPIDIFQLQDSSRTAVSLSARLSAKYGFKGQRKPRHLQKLLYARFQKVRTAHRYRARPDEIRQYLDFCQKLQAHAQSTPAEIPRVAERGRLVEEICWHASMIDKLAD